MLEHIDTGVIVLNAEGIVEDMNPAAQAVVAPHESEVLGAAFRDTAASPNCCCPFPMPRPFRPRSSVWSRDANACYKST